MYFPQQTKKDCVLILHICKLNVLTKLHEKQDAGKNALKERKNAKRKNNSFRMFPAPELLPINHLPTTRATDRKSLATTTASTTTTAPRMPHRAHEEGQQV